MLTALIALGIYGLGFFGALWLNLMIGPVTFGLALLRALVWPLWILTGWSEGQRF